MSEANPERKSPKELAAQVIINGFLKEVDQRYGPDGPTPLHYHSLQHTKYVLEAATAIADELIMRGGLEFKDLPLVRLAAAGHDLVHGKGSGVNEAESAEQVAQTMRQVGVFATEEIDRVQQIILATRLKVVEGKVQQAAPKGDLAAMVLCDADLASLGAEPKVFWQKSMDYERERLNKDQLSRRDINQLVKNQIDFMGGHSFYTQAAALLYPHKPANLHWLYTQYSL